LSLPLRSGPDFRPLRHWKNISAAEAVGMLRPEATIAVGWLGDTLATALADAYLTYAQPNNLTIVYSVTQGEGRTHGLNLLAHEGLVRRVVGGQWHPVPGLQALAATNRVEAYSLPVGVINRLFRDIANGLPGHLSRSGLGTFTDPRNGGGRLNRHTREQVVHLVRRAGDEALLFDGFPIDAALIGVAFMERTAEIAMTRESMTIAQAVRQSGGLVIAQLNRIGTLSKLPPGQIMVPDSMIDALVTADPRDRKWETFSPTFRTPNRRRLRLTLTS
jgi:propionate CoA-transferase